MVGQMLGQSAVVEAREVLEHQAGQELGLGELLGAELVPVRGEGPAGRVVRGLEDPAGGFAGKHISLYEPKWTVVHGFSPEHVFPGFTLTPAAASRLP